MSVKKLERNIEKIKRDITLLGPLRPGSMYESHSVCGKPRCRCSRAKNPVKHGPYNYLSYTFGGRSFTEFISIDEVNKVKREVKNYNKFMDLVKRLIDSSIKLARLRRGK